MRKSMRKGSKILAFFVALIMTSFVCIDASFFTIKANAQTVCSADDIVEDMGLGWNLGNSLDATGEGGANGQETSWGSPRVTEDLIKAVKAKGFNTVRVPVSWYRNITVDNGKYTINADWFARVKEVVDYAYNNGMYVILNIHHENWINRADLASSYSAMSTELKQVWTQIAEYFSDYDQHLIFEGMNEPRMEGAAGEWTGNSACYDVINKLDADFISTVRSVDSAYKNTRLLMVPGYAASGDYGIYSNLDKSLFNDPYVAASVHAYKPYDFAMGDGDHSAFSSDYKAELYSIFNDLRSFFTQDGIPVVIGEFSTSNYGYTNARVDWAEYYMTLAKEMGIACVLWDNNVEANNGGEAHGYINRSNNTWYSVNEPVVNKLLSVRNDSSVVWASKASFPLYAHNDYSSGTSLSVGSDGNIKAAELKDFASGKELAVKYSSQTAPKFALMNSGWGGWTELSACDYSYSNSGNTAYLRYDDIYGAWDSSANGELAYIKISNYDSISFVSAVMLDVKNSDSGDTDEPVISDVLKKRISLGYNHSAYINKNSELYMWGNNESGQLGNGAKTIDPDNLITIVPDDSNENDSGIQRFYSYPIKVMDDVSQISLGGGSSACITNNGDLYTWGSNYYGQLGKGSDEKNSSVPAKIMSGVKQVSMGYCHGACITLNGDLYTWGRNVMGQLGDGTTTDRNIPHKIMSNVAWVSLGKEHSACITTNGDLYIWGSNEYGQLGTSSKENSTTPQKIMSNVSQVSLGYYHSACITKKGDLFAWGNDDGGLPNVDVKTNRYIPVKIAEKVNQISLGWGQSSFISSNSELFDWRFSHSDMSENGRMITQTLIMSDVSQVSYGGEHCECITNNDELYTWGFNYCGQLGNGTTEKNSYPTMISIPKNHEHSLKEGYSANSFGHWRACTGCDDKIDYEMHLEDNGTITIEPTETSEGEKTYKCKVCGYVIRTEPIAKLDHKHVLDTNWTYDASGHWHKCSTCSEKVDFAVHTEDSGTITKQPTMTAEGEKTYKCKVCGYVIRTEAIPALTESAVAVFDGTEIKTFDDLITALSVYKTDTKALTITLNKDVNVKTISLPTKAESITFIGTGALNISATSLNVPTNTAFDVEVNGKGKTLAVRVSAGKTLDINSETTNIGAVSGTRTSVLNINEDTEITSLATFGTVNVANGKTFTVSSRLSAVYSLNGTVKFPTAKTTASTVTAGNAEIILTDGDIAKVTLADVTGKLNVKVVNENGGIVDLASGTIVLYSTKDISEKTAIENTTADKKELNAFYYKKNKAVKAEWADAVTLSYGDIYRQFPNVELALEGITDKNAEYTLTLNTDVTEPKFTLPKTAKSITINGTGALTTDVTRIAAPVDTTIGCEIKQSAGKAIALSAAANTTLTISAENSFGAVNGTRTSTLNINENIEAVSITSFSDVNVSENKTLTVTIRLTSISNLNGTVKLPTAKTTASTVTAGNAELVLTDGDIAKVTLTDVTNKLNVKVADENGEAVKLASGTIVLCSTKDISENTTVENTTADGKELNAFYYKKNKAIKAEWADAVTLSYGEASRKFPNIELALESITDKKTAYTLTLNTNLDASALALPTTAKSITFRSEPETKTITLTNITAVNAKTPLKLENIRIESTKPYTLSTTSDLTLDNFASDSITAVKGGAAAALTLGETTPIAKISGFGTTKVTSEFRTGSTFSTTALELTETANLIVSSTKTPASVKTINGAEGSAITFDTNFTPIKVTGTTADSISGTIKLKANEAIDENTVLFTSKYTGNNVFDVTEIQPETELNYTVTSISGKVYMKPILFEINGLGYALWTDVTTAIESIKSGEAQYTVTLLDDADINGALRLPRAGTYGKLTIASENKTLTFIGSITLTGELEVQNTNLDSARNNTSYKYTISAGRYAFTAENADLDLASITSTADVTLKNTSINGTVRAGKLTVNGTNTIFGTITATELCSTEGAELDILSNARGVMSITRNGITENSEEITIKLVDESGNAAAAENLSIIASSFKGEYNGQLKLSTENGEFSIVLVNNKLVLADSITASNGLIEEDEENETSEEESTDDPNEETPEDGSSDSSEEEASDDSDENIDNGSGETEEDTSDDTFDEMSA